jgi:hypothetical protein
VALQFNIEEIIAKESATDLPRILADGICQGYSGGDQRSRVFRAEADRKFNVINGLRDFSL